MNLIDNAKQFINENDLIKPDSSVLIAISGGPDSVALSEILIELKKELRFKIALVHINHQLRNSESDKDEQFVKKYSNLRNIKLHNKKIIVNNSNIEEDARIKRYNYFQNLAVKYSYNFIATGHNFDDNTETFLLNLFRGAGTDGLTGIPVKRDNIIRPLLFAQRDSIISFLKERKQGFRIDSSNKNTVFTRNWIRNIILPKIEKRYPKIKSNITRTSNILKMQNIFLKSRILKYITFKKISCIIPSKKYLNFDPFFRKTIIYYAVKNFNINISLKFIDYLDNKLISKDKIRIQSNNITLYKNDKNIIIRKSSNENKDFNYLINNNESVHIPECNCIVNLFSEKKKININNLKNKNTVYLDAKYIKFPVIIRNRKNSDRIMPLGMNKFKKIKNIFIDRKVPFYKREKIPLFISGNSIINIGYLNIISDKYKITDNTKNYIKIDIIKGNEE